MNINKIFFGAPIRKRCSVISVECAQIFDGTLRRSNRTGSQAHNWQSKSVVRLQGADNYDACQILDQKSEVASNPERVVKTLNQKSIAQSDLRKVSIL